MSYEFNILYYLDFFKKSGKRILTTVCVAVFLTMLISALLPMPYISTVTLFTPLTESSAISSVSRLFGISSNLGSSSQQVIISILKSKRMAKDINEQFNLKDKPRFWYKIDTEDVNAGIKIMVKGPNPAFTEKVANFVVQNLDKINAELEITTAKPMVKVLDPATFGEREPRQIPRKMLIAGILAFLIVTVYTFFEDYIKRLRMDIK
ncbi:MAG: hypothetical protein NC828_04975 [Candidatus Omnitrophica bacterium]|nr:hypothetical protein [Candidatus Omnitrophota bacterium]